MESLFSDYKSLFPGLCGIHCNGNVPEKVITSFIFVSTESHTPDCGFILG
jgi:hypothetical protein